MIGGVEELSAALDVLLQADLSGLSGAEVISVVRGLETASRRLAAVGHRVVAEVESRRLAGEYARSSTAELLVSELRITPGEAKARVARAGGGGAAAVVDRSAAAAAVPGHRCRDDRRGDFR